MSIATCPTLLLLLAAVAFTAQVEAVGICDYDVRTYTNQKGAVQFTTIRSGKYRSGYIGDVPFSSPWNSKDSCNLGDVSFKCVYADDGGILGTNITVPNITNVDAIYLDSTYPVTLHRIEDHVMDKSRKDRFIVDNQMRLTQCPKYKQTRLVWQFPGNLASRSAFECYRENEIMCRGVSTEIEQGKCLVKVVGGNLMHIRDVNASKSDVEFFYCRLDPATPHIAMTYNVDWRASKDVPPTGILKEKVVQDKNKEKPVIPPPPIMISLSTTSAGKQLTATGLGFLLGVYAVLANKR